MIKKTNLQDLLNSIQGKIDSAKSKQGKNQAKNQSQKENLLNYNKGLDST